MRAERYRNPQGCAYLFHTHTHTHTPPQTTVSVSFYSLTFHASSSQQKSASLYTCWMVMKGREKSRIERKKLC